MLICEVVGHVWATKKEAELNGMKLMVVQQVDHASGKKKENTLVAADVVGAGIGEKVLVVSGSNARRAFRNDNLPIDAAIVGIIDSVEVGI